MTEPATSADLLAELRERRSGRERELNERRHTVGLEPVSLEVPELAQPERERGHPNGHPADKPRPVTDRPYGGSGETVDAPSADESAALWNKVLTEWEPLVAESRAKLDRAIAGIAVRQDSEPADQALVEARRALFEMRRMLILLHEQFSSANDLSEVSGDALIVQPPPRAKTPRSH